MRSATWDAMADSTGMVTERSAALYHELNTGGIGLIITGFAYVSSPLGQAGIGQYGIYNDKMIPGWKPIIKEAHDNGSKIAMQIVHGGIAAANFTGKEISFCAVSDIPKLAARPHHEMTDEEIEGRLLLILWRPGYGCAKPDLTPSNCTARTAIYSVSLLHRFLITAPINGAAVRKTGAVFTWK